MICQRARCGEYHRLLKTCVPVAFCLILIACSARLSQSTLDAHMRQWTNANIASYSYDLVRYCFCDGSGETINVEVKDGVVVSARYANASSAVEPPTRMTVSKIYDVLQSAVYDNEVKVTAKFSEDGTLPIDVMIKRSTAMDGDLSINVSNFREI